MSAKKGIQYLMDMFESGEFSIPELSNIVINNQNPNKPNVSGIEEATRMVSKIVEGVKPIASNNITQNISAQISSAAQYGHGYDARSLAKQAEDKRIADLKYKAERAKKVYKNQHMVPKGVTHDNRLDTDPLYVNLAKKFKAIGDPVPPQGIRNNARYMSYTGQIDPRRHIQLANGGLLNRVNIKTNSYGNSYNLGKVLSRGGIEYLIDNYRGNKTLQITKGKDAERVNEVAELFNKIIVNNLANQYDPNIHSKPAVLGFGEHFDKFMGNMPEHWQRALSVITKNKPILFTHDDYLNRPPTVRGYWDPMGSSIFTRLTKDPEQIQRTLMHEMAHAFYAKSSMGSQRQIQRALRSQGLKLDNNDYWKKPTEVLARAIGYRGAYARGGIANFMNGGLDSDERRIRADQVIFEKFLEQKYIDTEKQIRILRGGTGSGKGQYFVDESREDIARMYADGIGKGLYEVKLPIEMLDKLKDWRISTTIPNASGILKVPTEIAKMARPVPRSSIKINKSKFVNGGRIEGYAEGTNGPVKVPYGEVLKNYANDLTLAGIPLDEIAKRYSTAHFTMHGKVGDVSELVKQSLAPHVTGSQELSKNFNTSKNSIVSNLVKNLALSGHTADMKQLLDSHGIDPAQQEMYIKEGYAQRSTVAYNNFIKKVQSFGNDGDARDKFLKSIKRVQTRNPIFGEISGDPTTGNTVARHVRNLLKSNEVGLMELGIPRSTLRNYDAQVGPQVKVNTKQPKSIPSVNKTLSGIFGKVKALDNFTRVGKNLPQFSMQRLLKSVKAPKVTPGINSLPNLNFMGNSRSSHRYGLLDKLKSHRNDIMSMGLQGAGIAGFIGLGTQLMSTIPTPFNEGGFANGGPMTRKDALNYWTGPGYGNISSYMINPRKFKNIQGINPSEIEEIESVIERLNFETRNPLNDPFSVLFTGLSEDKSKNIFKQFNKKGFGILPSFTSMTPREDIASEFAENGNILQIINPGDLLGTRIDPKESLQPIAEYERLIQSKLKIAPVGGSFERKIADDLFNIHPVRAFANGGDLLRNLHTVKNEGSVGKLLSGNALESSINKHISESDLYNKFLFYAPRLPTSTLNWKMKSLGANDEQLSRFMGMQGRVVANSFTKDPKGFRYFADGGQFGNVMDLVVKRAAGGKGGIPAYLSNDELKLSAGYMKQHGVNPKQLDKLRAFTLGDAKLDNRELASLGNLPTFNSSGISEIHAPGGPRDDKGFGYLEPGSYILPFNTRKALESGGLLNKVSSTFNTVPAFKDGGLLGFAFGGDPESERQRRLSGLATIGMQQAVNNPYFSGLMMLNQGIMDGAQYNPKRGVKLPSATMMQPIKETYQPGMELPQFMNQVIQHPNFLNAVEQNARRGGNVQKDPEVLASSMEKAVGRLIEEVRRGLIQGEYKFKNPVQESRVEANKRRDGDLSKFTNERYDTVGYAVSTDSHDFMSSRIYPVQKASWTDIKDPRFKQTDLFGNIIQGPQKLPEVSAVSNSFASSLNPLQMTMDHFTAFGTSTVSLGKQMEGLDAVVSKSAEEISMLVKNLSGLDKGLASLIHTTTNGQQLGTTINRIFGQGRDGFGKNADPFTALKQHGANTPININPSKDVMFGSTNPYQQKSFSELELGVYRGEMGYNRNGVSNDNVLGIPFAPNNQQLTPVGGMLPKGIARKINENKYLQGMGGIFDKIGDIVDNIHTRKEVEGTVHGTVNTIVGGRYSTGAERDTLRENKKNFSEIEEAITSHISNISNGVIREKEARSMVTFTPKTAYDGNMEIAGADITARAGQSELAKMGMKTHDQFKVQIEQIASLTSAFGKDYQSKLQNILDVSGTQGTLREQLDQRFGKADTSRMFTVGSTGSLNELSANDQRRITSAGFNPNDVMKEQSNLLNGVVSSNSKMTGIFDTATQKVTKLGIEQSKLNKAAGMFGEISWKAASISMASMGVYFSIQGLVMSIEGGLTKIIQPLTDVEGLFKNIGMSNAFGVGANRADKVMEKMGVSSQDMLDAWKNITAMQGTITTMFASLGAKVFGSNDFGDKIMKQVQGLFDELSTPESVGAIQDLLQSIATAVPEIISAVKAMVNIMKVVADNPWLIQMGAQLLMISLLIQPLTAGFSALFTVGAGFLKIGAYINAMSKAILIATVATDGLALSMGALLLDLAIVLVAWEAIGRAIDHVFKTDIPTPTKMIGGFIDRLTGNNTGGFANGTDYLNGPGTSTSDSIPAMLSRGERVIPADLNKKNFAAYEALERGNKFKDGVDSIQTLPSMYNNTSSTVYRSDASYNTSQLATPLTDSAGFNQTTSKVLKNAATPNAIRVEVTNWDGSGSGGALNGSEPSAMEMGLPTLGGFSSGVSPIEVIRKAIDAVTRKPKTGGEDDPNKKPTNDDPTKRGFFDEITRKLFGEEPPVKRTSGEDDPVKKTRTERIKEAFDEAMRRLFGEERVGKLKEVFNKFKDAFDNTLKDTGSDISRSAKISKAFEGIKNTFNKGSLSTVNVYDNPDAYNEDGTLKDAYTNTKSQRFNFKLPELNGKTGLAAATLKGSITEAPKAGNADILMALTGFAQGPEEAKAALANIVGMGAIFGGVTGGLGRVAEKGSTEARRKFAGKALSGITKFAGAADEAALPLAVIEAIDVFNAAEQGKKLPNSPISFLTGDAGNYFGSVGVENKSQEDLKNYKGVTSAITQLMPGMFGDMFRLLRSSDVPRQALSNVTSDYVTKPLNQFGENNIQVENKSLIDNLYDPANIGKMILRTITDVPDFINRTQGSSAANQSAGLFIGVEGFVKSLPSILNTVKELGKQTLSLFTQRPIDTVSAATMSITDVGQSSNSNIARSGQILKGDTAQTQAINAYNKQTTATLKLTRAMDDNARSIADYNNKLNTSSLQFVAGKETTNETTFGNTYAMSSFNGRLPADLLNEKKVATNQSDIIGDSSNWKFVAGNDLNAQFQNALVDNKLGGSLSNDTRNSIYNEVMQTYQTQIQQAQAQASVSDVLTSNGMPNMEAQKPSGGNWWIQGTTGKTSYYEDPNGNKYGFENGYLGSNNTTTGSQTTLANIVLPEVNKPVQETPQTANINQKMDVSLNVSGTTDSQLKQMITDTFKELIAELKRGNNVSGN